LVELSATTICDAMKQYCPKVDEVYLCGGGAHNQLLVEIIKQKLPETPVLMTDDLGVNVDWVEAAAFAWLAHQTIVNKPGNLPAATGAKGLRILGAVYPK